MPDRESQVIEDLIYYQYAKIITKSAMNVPDGKAATPPRLSYIAAVPLGSHPVGTVQVSVALH